MPTPPPSTDELLALAARAAGLCGGEAQATARWARELRAGGASGGSATTLEVEVAVVRDGRTGLATTSDVEEDDLRRAVALADALARTPAPAAAPARLGEPATARGHEGYDARVLGLDPARVADLLAASPAGGGGVRVAATKVAIASSAGVRAAEQRSFAELAVRRRTAAGALTLREVAVGPDGLDAARLAAEADELLGGAGARSGPGAGARTVAGAATGAVGAGEHAVVLGPWAVAELLRRAAGAFAGPAHQSGPLAGRFGTRVVAPSINLSDASRYPATIPRSSDAEGVPRQPVPLIQDGVAHRVVHDSTSAAAAGTASTGHAALPGGLAAPRPDHLVLVGGGAADVHQLTAALGHGLLLPSLSPAGTGDRCIAEGARVIRDGSVADPAGALTVAVDPFAVLAQVQALSASQRTIPASPGTPAWAMGATVCPALRAGGGIVVVA